MINLFDELNSEQEEAVKSTEGYVRVVAGAGSGKTRVIAHRFAYMVNELGILPGSILCITFTKHNLFDYILLKLNNLYLLNNIVARIIACI